MHDPTNISGHVQSFVVRFQPLLHQLLIFDYDG